MGRIENGGLRCLYHGWLFDVNGDCLEQPSEPADSEFRHKVCHLAYPCQEMAGIIFAYLGPGTPPLLPAYEPFAVPSEHRYVTKLFHGCNYFQAAEGNMDPSHTSFLHRQLDAPPDLKRPVAGTNGTFHAFLYPGLRAAHRNRGNGLRRSDRIAKANERRQSIFPSAQFYPAKHLYRSWSHGRGRVLHVLARSDR